MLRFSGFGHQLSKYILGCEPVDTGLPVDPQLRYELTLDVEKSGENLMVVLGVHVHRRDNPGWWRGLHFLDFPSLGSMLSGESGLSPRTKPTLSFETYLKNPDSAGLYFNKAEAQSMVRTWSGKIREVGFHPVSELV
jgi:hypothetical protein